MKASTHFQSAKTSVSVKFALGTMAIVSVILFAGITSYSQKGTAAGRKNLAALNAEEIAKRVLPSVVLIVCDDGKGNTSLGSGFFVKAPQDELDKLIDTLPPTRPQSPKTRSAGEHRGPVIVTSYHVIKGMIRGTARIAIDHRRQNLRISDILNYDEQSDLALLGLDEYDDVIYSALSGSRIRPLPLASTAAVRPGQTVFVLGNPEGLVGSISQGIISAAPRAFKGGTRIQLTASISPGSSGGPVVNSTGEVVGIAQFFLDEGQNLNFAVPVSLLSQLLKRTPSVPRFDDWERARSERKSEEDWLWIPQRTGLGPNNDGGVGSARELGAEWQLVASGRGNSFFISRARITPTPERTFLCWIKTVPENTPEGTASQKRYIAELNEANVNRSYAFSYTMDQDEFDCGHQRGRTLTSAYYDQAGVLLYNRDSSTRSEWIPVLPDSVYEELLNFVCKGKP